MIFGFVRRWLKHRTRHNDRMRRIIRVLDGLMDRMDRMALTDLRRDGDGLSWPVLETSKVLKRVVTAQKLWDRNRDDPWAVRAIDSELSTAEGFLREIKDNEITRRFAQELIRKRREAQQQ